MKSSSWLDCEVKILSSHQQIIRKFQLMSYVNAFRAACLAVSKKRNNLVEVAEDIFKSVGITYCNLKWF